MLTLEKIAGYQDDLNTYDKVAEAMDFMEENNINPIGGLTALMNVDENGQAADEKVASELNSLSADQIDALSQVADYLRDEDPETLAKVALDISDNAMVIEKVAEAMDYLDANGIEPESALIIAANVTPEGQFADEKVANDVIASGFTDADFTKIAEAIDYLSENEIGLDEAYEAMGLLKEAAISESEIRGADRLMSSMGKAIKRRAKGAWNGYKAAITGKGRDKIRNRISATEDDIAKAEDKKQRWGKLGNKKRAYELEQQQKKLKGNIVRDNDSIKQINLRQAKAIGGTALGAAGVGGAGYLATRKKS